MKALVPRLQELEEHLDRTEAPLAFADKGELQGNWCRAADYDDNWVTTYDTNGRIRSALRCWWICLSGGTSSPCGTLHLAKVWRRLKEDDPEASGQRWYCRCCSAKYRPSFGTLAEVHVRGTPYWLLAEEPGEFRDIKHMRVDCDHADATSSRDLYNRIMNVHPVTGAVMRPVTSAEVWGGSVEGVYKITALAELQRLPRFKWSELVTYANTASG